MEVGDEAEARAAFAAFLGSDAARRVGAQSTDPQDAQDLEPWPPEALRTHATGRGWLARRGELALCLHDNTHLIVSGRGIVATLLLSALDVPELAAWPRAHAPLPPRNPFSDEARNEQ